MRKAVRIKLWSINRWLRWTGFRVFVGYDGEPNRSPRYIGIGWYGLPGSEGWKKIEGHR